MTVGASSDALTDMTRATHSYGEHPSQLGELYLPAGSGPFPVTVVVHGGFWKAQYDRSLMEGLCADLAAHGLAAWNIEYRRVGAGGGWPTTLEDVGAAVDLLAELDAPLDFGAHRCGICGTVRIGGSQNGRARQEQETVQLDSEHTDTAVT